MAREVIWTPRAEEDLLNVCSYLDRVWGERVKMAFLSEVDEVVECIRTFPNIFRSSGRADIREALVTRHNLLFYRITGDRIYLLTLWDTRQDPNERPFPST